MTSNEPTGKTTFLTGGGEIAALIASYDWSRSLGPIDAWPQSLKTTVGLMLHSPVALVLLWGADGIMIYNDAYGVFAGNRHPSLLGSKVLEGWPEAAELNARVMAVGMAGGTLEYKDERLVLNRRGTPEEGWMDLFYSPVIDESGRPGGVIAVVVETTERVLVRRQMAAQAEQLAESEQRLQMALSAGQGIGTWDWDVQNDRVVADPRFARLYGVSAELARTGAPIADFFRGIHPQDVVRVQDAVGHTLGTGEDFSEEYRLVQPDGSVRWVVAQGRVSRAADGAPLHFPGVSFDITDRRRNEEHLELVVNELNHRVKNNLAMIQSIASQTFRNATDLAQARRSFEQRIMALSRANDLLVGNEGAQTSMAGVARQTLGSLWTEQPGRLQIEGPEVALPPKAGLSVALALHELGTNALKYGAWSNADGVVTIRWSREGGRFRLEWRESGGPAVTPPAARGFGSRLIERGLAAELGGSVTLAFEPAGLVCTVDAPFNLPGTV